MPTYPIYILGPSYNVPTTNCTLQTTSADPVVFIDIERLLAEAMTHSAVYMHNETEEFLIPLYVFLDGCINVRSWIIIPFCDHKQYRLIPATNGTLPIGIKEVETYPPSEFFTNYLQRKIEKCPTWEDASPTERITQMEIWMKMLAPSLNYTNIISKGEKDGVDQVIGRWYSFTHGSVLSLTEKGPVSNPFGELFSMVMEDENGTPTEKQRLVFYDPNQPENTALPN